MQKARATRKERAQNQPTCVAHCVAHSFDVCAFWGGAGRVWCAKSAAKFIETFANSSENREVFPQISVQKDCRAQDNLRDLRSMHQMIVRACCRRSARVCSCDRAAFQNFQRQNRAVLDQKTAHFWCKKSAPHAGNARRSITGGSRNV